MERPAVEHPAVNGFARETLENIVRKATDAFQPYRKIPR